MHKSISNEIGQKANNERLEFLGDSVLGCITATLLFEKLIDEAEGQLTKVKSAAVSEDALSAIAKGLDISKYLLMGRGEEISGGRNKKAILAYALEALIGAVYIDSGYTAAYNFVSAFIFSEINLLLADRHYRDYKSLLQELSIALSKSYPHYAVSKSGGPEHAPLFSVKVTVNGETFGPCEGKNKKSAEQSAAKIAYEALSKLQIDKISDESALSPPPARRKTKKS
jgi:ribonuclease-3